MSGNRFISRSFAVLAAVALGTAALPSPAMACGGFFCSANAPVNQAAERIIFSKNADDTVTAVVQIQYSGPSEEFAWVLPVPGVPEVNVSSDLAFQRLQAVSNPQYITTQVVEGQCGVLENNADFGPTSFGTGGSGGGGGSSGADDREVNVLAEGNVGPYDFVVIQTDPASASAGDVAVEWLTTEGYDVVPPGGDPASISELLGSYLEGGMNLLAFRLTKGNATGTIRPIWITYDSDQPMIPIRPTAVAADDDMGVLVWVLGDHRAVPVNYRSLVLNEALIDWPQAAANYNQVVIAAANEAGGQGFVTERAGAAGDYEDVVISEFELGNWDFLSTTTELTSADLLSESAFMFVAWDGYRDVVARYLPEDIDVDGFLQCPVCEPNQLDFDLVIDQEAFIEDMEGEVIDPMIATQELLLSRPYVTRLYTTLSAPEMDLDPLFDFNPDLEGASNLHNATQVIECSPGVTFAEAPSRFELEDGQVVRLAAGAPWPFAPGDDGGLPANAQILQLSTSGEGSVIQNNAAAISTAVANHNDTVPPPPAGFNVTGGACAAHADARAASGFVAALLVGMALLVTRRRRRTQR
ncbi:MAG: DUF2330 domain-containing protein [Myxococcota bacterium]